MFINRRIIVLGIFLILPLYMVGQIVPPPIPPPPPPGLPINQGEYFLLGIALVFGVIEIRKGRR